MRIEKKKTSLVILLALLAACSDEAPPPRTDLPDKESEGAVLVLTNCTLCHGAPSPSQHKKEEWAAVVHRMQNWRTTKGFVAIGQADEQKIVNYLQDHVHK